MLRVKREEFLGKLQSVRAGLSQREVVEQSSCFVFLPGQILTFNDEVSCRIAFDHKFTGAVPAKPLTDLLSKMPEDEIELEMSEVELLVKGVKRRAGIKADAEILNSAAGVERPEDWKALPEGFSEALELVSSCAGSDSSRFNLTCVHFHPRYLEAMDNIQMTRYKIKLPIEDDCLLRRDSLKQVVTLGMKDVAETEAWLHFRNQSGLILSCRRYREEFPVLAPIMDFVGERCVLPGGLAQDTKLANIFSAESTDKDQKVLVQIRPQKVRIRGQGSHGWFECPITTTYDGDPLDFMISPKILMDLTKKGNECEVTERRLKVVGERYTYVSCLYAKPEMPGKKEE